MRLVLLCSFFWACTDKELRDDDGDGYLNTEDCNDFDPNTHPDAREVCDGKDNNCDDLIDNNPTDAPIFYLDKDGDGYGSMEFVDQVQNSCEQPEGTTLSSTDCNDSLEAGATVYPGATETCDEYDNDCDGVINNEPIDMVVLYFDDDGSSPFSFYH